MRGMTAPALEHFKAVVQSLQRDIEGLADSLWAAGQVDDETIRCGRRLRSGSALPSALSASSPSSWPRLCRALETRLRRRWPAGVTSRGPRPVPPVVTMTSTSPPSLHAFSRSAIRSDSSGTMSRWISLNPLAVINSTTASPLVSSRSPFAPASLLGQDGEAELMVWSQSLEHTIYSVRV